LNKLEVFNANDLYYNALTCSALTVPSHRWISWPNIHCCWPVHVELAT